MMSAFSWKYCKACTERDVPTSVLVANLELFRGKPDEEQVKIKDRLAKEIEDLYPYAKGKEPMSSDK